MAFQLLFTMKALYYINKTLTKYGFYNLFWETIKYNLNTVCKYIIVNYVAKNTNN